MTRKSREPRLVSAFGESKTVMQWVHDPRCAVELGTLYTRLRVPGASAEDAISIPPVAKCLPWADPTAPRVTNPTPPRTYGNHAMPRGSLRINHPAPARDGADDHFMHRSIG